MGDDMTTTATTRSDVLDAVLRDMYDSMVVFFDPDPGRLADYMFSERTELAALAFSAGDRVDATVDDMVRDMYASLLAVDPAPMRAAEYVNRAALDPAVLDTLDALCDEVCAELQASAASKLHEFEDGPAFRAPAGAR
jgi:hypothetical protein